MAQYGQLLGAYEPEKDSIYKYFDDYFGNPIMSKVKNVGGLSMYMSKLYCLLTNECRYIVAMVKQNSSPIKTSKALKEMSWVSLQTRTLADKHDLPPHNYHPVNKGPLQKLITRIQVTEKASTYHCKDLPIVVTLLHTKPESKQEYQPRGTIISALETYHTIITLKQG